MTQWEAIEGEGTFCPCILEFATTMLESCLPLVGIDIPGAAEAIGACISAAFGVVAAVRNDDPLELAKVVITQDCKSIPWWKVSKILTIAKEIYDEVKGKWDLAMGIGDCIVGLDRSCACFAVANGWTGVVLYGCVRDCAELAAQDLGVRALGSIPLRSEKRGVGERDVPVRFAGVAFRPDDYVYLDEDGIVVAHTALA